MRSEDLSGKESPGQHSRMTKRGREHSPQSGTNPDNTARERLSYPAEHEEAVVSTRKGEPQELVRKAFAQWKGTLRHGKGEISSESGALQKKAYTFESRFQDEALANPEELIGAAHAACVSMVLAAELEKRHLHPEEVRTSAVVVMHATNGSWEIRESRLESHVLCRDVSEHVLKEVADAVRTECPVSKVLNTRITLEVFRQTS